MPKSATALDRNRVIAHGNEIRLSKKNGNGVIDAHVKNDNFFNSGGIHGDFFRDLWNAFSGPMYVSGSYVLWCLLNRPSQWKPGDIDVYLTNESPHLFSRVLEWVKSYQHNGHGTVIKNDDITNIKIDVEFTNFGSVADQVAKRKRVYDVEPIRVSLIFQRVQDAVPQFDLSVVRTYIPVTALFESVSAIHFYDVRDLEDIAAMRARTHKFLATRPAEVNDDVPEHMKEIYTKNLYIKDWLFGRMQKYEERGFEIYAEEDADAAVPFLASIDWYTDLRAVRPERPLCSNDETSANE